MKLIPLSRGLFAQVDDEDYDFLMQWKWSATRPKKNSKTIYGVRSKREKDKFIQYRLHRVIMKITDPKILIDHKDINGLNCQKSNLRIATFSQNNVNRNPKGVSKYIGVSFDKDSCRWRAETKKDKKTYKLGRYSTEEEAARAYDKKAKELHGEFANLNFKDE